MAGKLMYYIKGTHRQFGNVLWLEAIGEAVGTYVRPTPDVLHAEAFDAITVQIVRQIFGRNYPEYNWQLVDANSNKIIPAKMRKVFNCA